MLSPDRSEYYSQQIQNTVPGSEEEQALFAALRAERAGNASTVDTIIKDELTERKEQGNLFVRGREAQHVAHVAVEAVTTGSHRVPTEAEKAAALAEYDAIHGTGSTSDATAQEHLVPQEDELAAASEAMRAEAMPPAPEDMHSQSFDGQS